MPKFEVRADMGALLQLEIEAATEADAYTLAKAADWGAASEVPNSSYFDIYSVKPKKEVAK